LASREEPVHTEVR
jgi:NADH dehydrogenase FAD-containing subunit